MGTDEEWEMVIDALKEALEEKGMDYALTK